MLVVFEAIGVPGIIDGVLRDAPHSTRLVVVGVCMEHDRINPFFGHFWDSNLHTLVLNPVWKEHFAHSPGLDKNPGTADWR